MKSFCHLSKIQIDQQFVQIIFSIEEKAKHTLKRDMIS